MALEQEQAGENYKHLFPQKKSGDNYSAIKWGMVLIGFGLALLIGEFFAYDISEGGVVGLTFLLAGAALLLSYKIIQKKADDPAGSDEVK